MSKPAIILVRPQMGENIGAAARAMLNFGLTDLRLVNPRDGWPNQSAQDMSSGALEQFQPTLYDSLADSLADCHLAYATTARTRDMQKEAATALKASEEALNVEKQGQKVAFVFGPERTGLENDDIVLCHKIVHIPTNPDFSSLNLGQCVLAVCYQYFNAEQPEISHNMEPPATQEEYEFFFERLAMLLDQENFFRSHAKNVAMGKIRNMFLRSNLSTQELSMMHGIVSALSQQNEHDPTIKKAANGDEQRPEIT